NAACRDGGTARDVLTRHFKMTDQAETASGSAAVTTVSAPGQDPNQLSTQHGCSKVATWPSCSNVATWLAPHGTLSLFDTAVDQQILKLHDPGSLLSRDLLKSFGWGIAALHRL